MFKDFMKSFIFFYLFYLWLLWWLRWERICLQYRRSRFYVEPGLIPGTIWYLGWKEPLEKGMANHSSILVWRIPWTEESCGLQSMGSQRVRQDWMTEHAYIHVLVWGLIEYTRPLLLFGAFPIIFFWLLNTYTRKK